MGVTFLGGGGSGGGPVPSLIAQIGPTETEITMGELGELVIPQSLYAWEIVNCYVTLAVAGAGGDTTFRVFRNGSVLGADIVVGAGDRRASMPEIYAGLRTVAAGDIISLSCLGAAGVGAAGLWFELQFEDL